jgi:hypothetical protein
MRSILIFGYILFAGVACALDNYIIVMKPNSPVGIIDTILKTLLGGLVVGPLQRFSIGTAFSGFTCPLSAVQVTLLQMDPNVSRYMAFFSFSRLVNENDRVDSANGNRFNTLKKTEPSTYLAPHLYGNELRLLSPLEYGV